MMLLDVAAKNVGKPLESTSLENSLWCLLFCAVDLFSVWYQLIVLKMSV